MRFIFMLAACAIATSCGHSTVRWRGGQPLAAPLTGPIFVLIVPGPALPPASADFPKRLLALVREQDPKAELIYGDGKTSGSSLALQRGARFLLVARILRWRDAQTQYDGEPDEIAVNFSMMTLQPTRVVREFEFDARGSRLAVRNAAADRLLNDKFRKAIRRLLASTHS